MDRKQFLHAAAAATFTSVLPKRPARGTPQDKQQQSESQLPTIDGVQLAIASICTDGFGNQHHEPAMKFIPQLGFKNVELNLLYPDHITPRYVSRLKQRCQDAGLKPVSLHGIGFGAQGGKNGIVKDVAHKLLMMQYARQLDCHIVKFTGSKKGTQGGLQSIIKVCKELAPVAEEMGVLVTLENHAGNNLESIADYETVFSQIESANIGLCLDTGHFEGAGIELKEVVERFHDRTLHVDLKDCRAFGKGHDTVPFGTGQTDFDAFLKQLIATDYKGYLVVEQAWKEPQGDWKADLKSAAQRFKKWTK